MPFIADLHVHSHLSRATSKTCNLAELHRIAQTKGVDVVGTGDITHPQWFGEIQRALVPADNGLFRLDPDLAHPIDAKVPPRCRGPVEFMLTGEISHIYKRGGATRKVHSLVLLPHLAAAEALVARLDAIGNIRSDGRPILGLDPRDLLEMLLDIDEACVLIPAHIWTPWFSMLGSKSGFDSPAECFGDLLSHIFAIETGLSSDPPMNWRVSSLDGLTLISNSDLHSPGNLGRNANLFRCERAFNTMIEALRKRDAHTFGGTIDMFPEQGKYHLDGHRKCGVCMEPEESLERDCRCPVCDKPLVLGVLHRVVALADRKKGARPDGVLPHEYIIPLRDLLSDLLGVGPNTKTVTKVYENLLTTIGPELTILRDSDPEHIESAGQPLLAEAIRRVRAQRVIRIPGFDGQYGSIGVFEPGEKDRIRNAGRTA